MSSNNISGTYIYRSLLNDQTVEQNFSKLEFGRGVMVLQQNIQNISGTFDMGGGYLMTLDGSVFSNDTYSCLKMTGYGKPNTITAGWIYEYFGLVLPIWPNAVNQIPTVTGSVIRNIAHGTSKAGVSATFYLVFKG